MFSTDVGEGSVSEMIVNDGATVNCNYENFHCRIGTDRTGIVALLLLSMMGAGEEVLYRDYLASNFANIEGARDAGVPDTFICYLKDGNCNNGKYVYNTKDALYGDSIASRARQYLEMCGVTEEQLGVITEELSGETPAQVLARVNACARACAGFLMLIR